MYGDDVPYGAVTSFPRAVQAKEDETVIFSWIVYGSRASRDAAKEKVMADQRLKKMIGKFALRRQAHDLWRLHTVPRGFSPRLGWPGPSPRRRRPGSGPVARQRPPGEEAERQPQHGALLRVQPGAEHAHRPPYGPKRSSAISFVSGWVRRRATRMRSARRCVHTSHKSQEGRPGAARAGPRSLAKAQRPAADRVPAPGPSRP